MPTVERVLPEVLPYLRTIGPLVVIAVPILLSLRLFRPIARLLSLLIPDFVSIDSVLPDRSLSSKEAREARKHGVRIWRQMVFAGLGAVEVGYWTAVTGMNIVQMTNGSRNPKDLILSIGMIGVWVYLALRPLFRPPRTPQWSSLISYLILWATSLVTLGFAFYIRASSGTYPYWVNKWTLGSEIANTIVTTLLVLLVLGQPLVSSTTLALLPNRAPDDTVTVFSWLSFIWVNPFINLGNMQELNPEDLPQLSVTMQTAIVFDRFRQLASSTLLRKLFLANRRDLFFDAAFTITSVFFNYASPFFLKRILSGLTLGTPEAMSQAYVFAILAFMASSMKAVTDVVHLWHGRRGAVRIKAELTAAVYNKALRRKDASGLAAKKEDEAKDKDGADEKKDEKKEEKKSNADTGKIVNLMASDCARIGNSMAGLYFLYGSPVEIVIASIFLYNILGWSAFAGIIVLAIVAPLNAVVSKQSVKITQDLMKCRDKRLGVMSELLGAIQFIKFFAWIDRWKKRAQDARDSEMKQMRRSLVNSFLFALIWNIAPILVTVVSFFCYIVIAKRELTVAIAFTSISLFSMLRMPLNIIPTFWVFLLQSNVAVKRIEDFLNEEEVPEWVSSLMSSPESRSTGVAKIAFENATFRWNSGEKTVSEASGSKNSKTSSSASGSEDATAVNEEDPANVVFHLSNLNVKFPIGKLTVVTGPTGSGKTAVLIALLGEMELLDGECWLPKETTVIDKETGLRNSVAYAAQTPWLQQKSIKDNILFGEKFDEERYEATVAACALVPDFDMLEDGDMTEIGAKGVSLSGGQKARVALARAVYSYARHLLLDDPLAAVDSHTAAHLTEKCLNGPLMKDRTVILVSHHVELLLPSADYLVRILDGRIDAQGTPAELRAAGELDGLIALEEAEASKVEPIISKEEVADEAETVIGDVAPEKKEKKKGPGKKLVQDEERAVGNVKWETYKLYIVAVTGVVWAIAFTFILIVQLSTVGERYWLKVWGKAYDIKVHNLLAFARPSGSMNFNGIESGHAQQHVLHHTAMARNSTEQVIGVAVADPIMKHLPSAVANPIFYLTVYTIIVVVDAVLGAASWGAASWGQYRAAVTIHDRLLNVMMRGSIRFFTVTPVGRILNRFSKDIETIDGSLMSSLETVIVYVASLIGAVAVVATIVPWFLLPASLITYLYWRYSVQYLKVGRSLRRLEATLRSPIFSGFAELLDGVVSVRAFSVEARFMDQLCEAVDQTHSAFYYYWMMNRWLLLRFDILGAASVFFTTLFALTGAVDAGSAGMAILSAQSFVQACYWVSRFWGQLEMDFNAVERVQEYLGIPQEPPAIIEGRRPPAYWPSSDSGDEFLSVRDLEIKYAPDLPSVFKGSFDVKAGEKIGLIGRTGSGKSTLAMSLLRFTEPTSGSIWLDGIDITSIGVDDLRSRITYIPQDAVLFSGTVKENLDPFNEHSDEELLDALHRVNLGPRDTPAPSKAPSRVPSSYRLNALIKEDAENGHADGADTPGMSSLRSTGATKVTITLTTEVSAGGSNFSQGQRQLVAMARALLRRSNLIIMDEATASVDFATDESIQKAIRTEFKNSTLVTIAHRLSSVIDYDRLLVLSDGKVAEFDTPLNLLKDEGSLFKSLCEKSGKYRELYRAAEKKANGEGSSSQ